MTSRTIEMSASPNLVDGLPAWVKFTPKGQITESVGTEIKFEAKASLLEYIQDKDFSVVLVWQNTTLQLDNNNYKKLHHHVGDNGDSYKLIVTSNLLHSGGGENSTTTSGDIIVK